MTYSKSFHAALILTILLAASNVSFGSVSKDTGHRVIPQSVVAERLLNAANAELPAIEVVMTDNAVRDLEVILTRAANRLVQDNADEETINQAVNKVRELARGLKERGTRRADGRIRIDRSTIAGIRDWFCPTYPICN